MDYDGETILYELSGKANSIMRKSFEICAPLYKAEAGIHYDIQFNFIQLFSSCYLSSESALILIANYRLWDTEILYRSVLEGTIKLFYLSSGTIQDVSKKCNEFWIEIPECKMISRHYKAMQLLEKIDDGSSKYLPIRELLLTDEELNELTERYSHKYRRKLDQKWSFSEMVKVLSDSDIKGFDTLIAAYYGYSLSSHLIHQDGDAIGLIWDRNNRDIPRKQALELAHGARLISDILSLAMLRTGLYLRFYKIGTEAMVILSKAFNDLQSITSQYYDEWIAIEYD
ncbi:MAG: DUF5677 domain-containing protein [Syntrophomonas sp.]